MEYGWVLGILLATILGQHMAAGDQLIWPFSWLKIGMKPELPPIARRAPTSSSSSSANSNGRPKSVDRFLGVQTQQSPRLPGVHFWGAIGDSTKTENRERPIKKAAGVPTVEASSTTTPSQTTSSLPADLKMTGVAKACAPGENCRIHLRSFQTGDPLFQYAYSHSSSIDPVLQEIYDTTRGSSFTPPLTSDTTVAPEVVKFAMGLIRALRANRVLVVGVFTGLAVVGASLSLEYGGQVIGVEDPRYIKYWNSIGSKYALESGLSKNIVIQSTGPVDEYLESLAKSQPNTFDFVFLDDNDSEKYGQDYEHALKLLRPRGIMLINDVFMEGEVLSGLRYRTKGAETVLALNRKIRDDNRLDTSVMLPYGGGIVMAVKK